MVPGRFAAITSRGWEDLVHTTVQWRQRVAVAGAAIVGIPTFIGLAAAPAAAAPITYGTAQTVTYSDTVLDPGQSFTIAISTNLPFDAFNDFGSFVLHDLSKWVYDGCTVTVGQGICRLDISGDNAADQITVFLPANTQSTVVYTFHVAVGASDSIAYDGALANADGSITFYSGSLTIDVGCTITGTSGNDTLTGTSGPDVICGLGGNDSISAGNGNDIIYAGDGDDSPLNGGNGNDTIYGGNGNDNLNGQNGDDTLADHTGTDTLTGGLGNDSIDTQDTVAGDTANGGLGSDTCAVDAGDSTSSC